jgi:hypothetical protein
VIYRSGDATFEQDKLLKAIFQNLQHDLEEPAAGVGERC